MPLINLLDAELAYGLHPLLDRAALAVEAGERIGLIGRNGTGKSSLLNVIAGTLALDDGELQRADGLRVVLVEQEPVLPAGATLRESLASRGGLERIDDERARWRAEARLVEFLHRFGLDGATSPQGTSGGERKRAALALAFALEPQLLLLDEPTNHLDIDGIELLEQFVVAGPASIVITHDRQFLDRVATRIVELDRGLLRSYPGNFAAYERRKAEQLAEEAVLRRKFDKFWAQEEVWIRKGVEARRTRNEGRVKRLERLRDEREARRERIGNVRLTLDAGERSGKLVAELTGVSKSYDGRPIVRDLDLRILRGDRFGIVGPNGAGKSTLLKLILGELAPDAGEVRLGVNLSVAYFDQLRAQLDPERSVAETISPTSDWVEVGPERKHVISYLGDFLFSPQRAGSPVKMLSGGERNRLLLARLFARPANVLVLDEPTNDLDIESLELLEDTLQDYPGTLLLVSHDRAFLDNVVTQTVAPLGDGRWKEYVGGYSDWLRQRPAAVRGAPSPAPRATSPASGRGSDASAASRRGSDTSPASRRGSDATPASRRGSDATPASGRGSDTSPARAGEVGRSPGEGSGPSPKPTPAKLSYKENRELEQLPVTIEALEREQKALAAAMAGPDYHKRGATQMRADAARATEIEQLLEAAFERWAELDLRRNAQR